MASRITLVATLLIGLICSIGGAQAQNGDYTINPLDRLEVKVARWSASDRVMMPIDFLSGPVLVDSSGAIELPVAGRIVAGGLTVGALTTEVVNTLKSGLGLVDDLHVAVSVATFAPIFVVGAVETPGSYEYRPGLNTLQAVALAGGVRRSNTLFSRTDRDAVSALGNHRLLEVDRWRVLAEIARLQAELDDKPNIEVPDELKDVDMADELLSVEQEIMEARREDLSSALAAISDLEELVKARVEKLNSEKGLREKLLSQVRQEAEATEGLVKRGLASNSRANDVRRDVAELEARMLEIDTSELAAAQQLNEAQRDALDLTSKRRVSIITDLQAARTELSQIRVKLETASALFAEAARFGSTVTELNESAGDRTPTFVVSRSGPGGPQASFEADSGTSLRPGDVLEVRAPDIDGAAQAFAPTTPSLLSSFPELVN